MAPCARSRTWLATIAALYSDAGRTTFLALLGRRSSFRRHVQSAVHFLACRRFHLPIPQTSPDRTAPSTSLSRPSPDSSPALRRRSAGCFVSTLLLAEYTVFYRASRHRPSANYPPRSHQLSRGGAARGAVDNHPAWLANNLFLSRDKRLDQSCRNWRSLPARARSFKDRNPRISLNITKGRGGPNLCVAFVLAARRYFGRAPRELTPAEMSFLFAISPGATPPDRPKLRQQPRR